MTAFEDDFADLAKYTDDDNDETTERTVDTKQPLKDTGYVIESHMNGVT
jgi:hypothetical protein